MNREKEHLKMVTGGTSTSSTLPALLRQIKDDALSILSNSLDELFAHCDDLFFDLSSRAVSNNEQNLYFESMRELRVKKPAVLNAFRQHMEQSFLKLGQPDAGQGDIPGTTGLGQTADSLTLVQNDELEQEVALTGMTQRARAANQEALYHLNMRIDYLVSTVRVNQDNNPLDPEQISRNFARACELFDINIKARIIIFKQFERLVAARFIKVYTSANELLINAGILPKIARQVNKHADTADSSETSDSQAGVSTEVEPMMFDFGELSNLLSSMRRLGLRRLPNYSTYSSNPGPLMSSGELLSLLSGLQLQNQFDPAELSASPPPDLRQLVQSLLTASDPKLPQALQQPDEDVINLVAMFFDFVLDDRNLPVAIQALISRLQIPILKVALRDKSFFSQPQHPARRLINTVASASIGWDESDQPRRDKLYNAICDIVQAVNESYRDNDQIFIDKLTELERLITEEHQRTALVEKRTSQSVEGQARTQQAKTAVQTLLFGKMENVQLPAEVTELISQQWQQLLILVHLRHGEESPEWLQSIQLVDDLLWASVPHEDTRSQQRLAKISPSLLERLASGLERLATPEGTRDKILRDMESLLNKLQQGEAPELASLTAAQAVSLGHTPGSGSKSWQEMTALERQQARYKALTYEFIRKAETLPLGTWLSYEDSRRGKILRCKLAARISASDTYVFVNRFGFKVLEKPRKDFAYDMQQSRASLLETGPLFERAMANIVNNLRSVVKPQTSPG